MRHQATKPPAVKREMLGQHGSAIGRIAVAALTLSFLLANARAADPGAEPKAAPEPVDVEVFIGARPLRPPPALAYPAAEQRRGKEGWVILNMMIDPKGQPYEVGVLDSTGNAALEQAAVAAVQEMPFEPAKSGSTPIDSSLTLKMIFSGPVAERGASEKFRAAYKRLIAAIEAGNKEQADAELPNLQPDNLFEDAYRSFGKYLYDRQWGTEAEQLTDLKRTVAGESNNRFLPKEVFVSALAALLGLQVKQHDYGSALYTWKILRPLAPKELHAKLQPAIDKIIALRSSDQPVTLHGQIDQTTGAWYGRLFKNHFALLVASGTVSEIKLRCDKKYVFFEYDPTLQYTVSPKVGDCSIQVVGDPGTTFDLAQS